MRAWSDHVHDSFGPELRMPSGAEFLDCIPVHYATEEDHLGFHAKSLYIRHNLAIGCLTDQAGEQYNQLVKHDITPGQLKAQAQTAKCLQKLCKWKGRLLTQATSSGWKCTGSSVFSLCCRRISSSRRVGSLRNAGAAAGPATPRTSTTGAPSTGCTRPRRWCE